MVKMGYVWDRTIEFLGDHVAALMPIAVLAIFLPASISDSLAGLQESAGFGLKLGLALMAIAFSILSLWGQLAITALAIDPALGRRAHAIATARLLPAIGVFVIVLLGFVVLALPLVGLLAAAGVDFESMAAGAPPVIAPGYGWAIALYMLAYLLAVIFVGARLLTLTSIVVAERRGLGAIPRALGLTRGLTWKLVGVLILYAAVALVAALAAKTVFGSVLRIVAGGDGPITIGGVITSVVVAAVSTAFTVLAAAFAAKLYVAILRARDAAAALAADAPTPA